MRGRLKQFYFPNKAATVQLGTDQLRLSTVISAASVSRGWDVSTVLCAASVSRRRVVSTVLCAASVSRSRASPR